MGLKSTSSRLRLWAGAVAGIFVLFLGFGASASAAGTPVIVDTDMFTSADDVGALATAYALQVKGEANVIAVTLNTRTSNGQHPVAVDTWKCVSAINYYYDSATVPIGTQTPLGSPAPNNPDFLAPCADLAPSLPPASQVPDAVTVMRGALASVADGSAVIVTTGYEGNLADLLSSPVDGLSPMNGHDLVLAKVKMLVVMGGGFPSFVQIPSENNFYGDPPDAQYVATHWPTKLVYSGEEVGNGLGTGQTVTGSHPLYSPVRMAYEAFSRGPNNYFDSHDLTAVYHAIRPADPFLTEVGPGTNQVDGSDGTNVFTLDPLGTQFYLAAPDRKGLANALEDLLDTPAPTPAGVKPVGSGPPAISGTVQIGQTLAASTGTWSGSPTSFSYQWLDCDSSGHPCTPIPQHAVFSTYVVDPHWVSPGDTIKVEVWASVPGASSDLPETSVATAAVLPSVIPPPSNTAPPTISGTARDGQTLSASPGVWNSLTTPSYGYQWERCDSASCQPIDPATSQTYTLTPADAGYTIKVAVTASNAGGPGPVAESAATAVVLPLPPANIAAPTISGTAQAGQTLTAVGGTWSNNPTARTYQWQACDTSGGSCAPIAGATSQSYPLTSVEVGHTIRVQETASNDGGNSAATSDATALVSAPAPPATKPAKTSLPVISGSATVGHTLTSSVGGWTGTQPISTTFQWQRCKSSCLDVGGATHSTYTPGPADQGAMLQVVVSATNGAGTTQVTTRQFGPIMPTPATIRSLLSSAFSPRGASAKIGKVLRAGGYWTTFAAPSAGRLVISWYYQPKRGKRVLVATVTANLVKAGPAKVKLALTAGGRKLLKAARSVKLTASGSFAATGQSTTSTSKTLALKR